MAFTGLTQKSTSYKGLRRFSEKSRAWVDPPFTFAEGAPGYKLIFYDVWGVRQAEISSDTESGYITSAKFALETTGCATGEIVFSEIYSDYNIDYQTRVDLHLAHSQTPSWSGYVDDVPGGLASDKKFKYQLSGYFKQLDEIIINRNFQGVELSEIVRRLVLEEVVPNSQIQVDWRRINRVGYVVQDTRFHYVKMRKALEQLAGLAWGYDFGVDANRMFFFRKRSTEITEERVWVEGKHFDSVKPETDSSDVANKLYVKSGKLQEDGGNFVTIVQDDDSIDAYGVRTDVVTAPSILDDADAERWGEHELSERKDPVEKFKLSGVQFRATPYEASGYGRYIDREGTSHDCAVKKIEYVLQPNKIVCNIHLGGIVRPLEDTILDLLRTIKNDEILQASNVKQLYDEQQDQLEGEPRNLIMNPSFEEDTDGDGIPNYWVAETGATLSQAPVSEVSTLWPPGTSDGDYVAKLVAASTNQGFYQTLDLEPSTEYTFSADIGRLLAGTATEVHFLVWDVANSLWLANKITALTAGDWTRAASTYLSFTSLNTTGQVQATIRVTGAAGTIYVDKVMLNKGGLMPWTPPVAEEGSTAAFASVGVNDAGTNYKLWLASNSNPDHTADRTLTFDVENVDRTFKVWNPSFNNVTLAGWLKIEGDIGPAADADLLQLAANLLVVNGELRLSKGASASVIAEIGNASGIRIDSRRAANIANDVYAYMYYTGGGGVVPWSQAGHLILQPRTSAARDIYFYTGNGAPIKRLAITSGGGINAGAATGATAAGQIDASYWIRFLDTATASIATKCHDACGLMDEELDSDAGPIAFNGAKAIQKSMAFTLNRARTSVHLSFQARCDASASPMLIYVAVANAAANMNMVDGGIYHVIRPFNTQKDDLTVAWGAGEICIGWTEVEDDPGEWTQYRIRFTLEYPLATGTYYANVGADGGNGDFRNFYLQANE